MKQLPIILFVTLLGYACNNAKQKTILDSDSLRLIIEDTSAKQSLDENDEDTSIHYHLANDSSKTIMENLRTGWLDTFSIDKQNFRLRFDTSAVDHDYFCIEQLKNEKWTKLFNLYLCSDEYEREDINKDGYIDLVKFYHERNYIYFYDPVSKTLSDTVCIMPEDDFVINKDSFILYNYYGAMYGNPYQSSQVYTYKGRQPYFYYQLLFVDSQDDDFKKINLYKFRDGNYNDTVFIKTIESGNNIKFEYQKYWTKHYKELMDYR